MDGIAHRLRTTSEIFCYPRGTFSWGARKKDLAAAQHERIGGAQALLESLVLLFGKCEDEDWGFMRTTVARSTQPISDAH